MIYERSFFPEILIHPGETLKDILDAENMTQKELSLRTEISEKHISNIIKGKASITTDTALIFEKIFGMSAVFWNNLQKSYDEDLSRLEEKEGIEKKLLVEKKILSEIKDGYKNLAEGGFVEEISFVGNENKENILNNLYSFFKVSSLKNIKEIFNIPKLGINFKKTKSLKLNEYNLACWLRAGEINIEKLDILDFSKVKLKEVLLVLKSMTKEKVVNVYKIQSLLSEAGVYFSFVNGFKNVPVFGITRRYKGKPFIQVSDKGKRSDSFWFALFHELSHVLLHLQKKDDILINIDNREETKEKEANEWACDFLINAKAFQSFSQHNSITMTNFQEFANNQGVGTSILAGRLAYHYHGLGITNSYREFSQLRETLRIINS